MVEYHFFFNGYTQNFIWEIREEPITYEDESSHALNNLGDVVLESKQDFRNLHKSTFVWVLN